MLYSEKAHFGIATVWGSAHFWLGLISTVSAAIAGLKAPTEPSVAIGASVLAAISAAIMTFLNPAKQHQTHYVAGSRYAKLRGELRRYVEIDLKAHDAVYEHLRKALTNLADAKTEIQMSSPHTGGLAYWLGKQSIKKKQHTYKVDLPGSSPKSGS